MAKDKNPFELLAAKEARKANSTKDIKKEDSKNSAKDKNSSNNIIDKKSKDSSIVKKELKSKKSTSKLKSKKATNSNNDRKLIRVHNKIHELAKFNQKYMSLSDYVEALISISSKGGADWDGYEPLETLVPHKEEKVKTLFRVLPLFHRLAKFNQQRMKLQDYVEALVMLDQTGKINWDILDTE